VRTRYVHTAMISVLLMPVICIACSTYTLIVLLSVFVFVYNTIIAQQH
jgi:hypothetical protein